MTNCIPQWTNVPPGQDGQFWLSINSFSGSRCKPYVVTIYDTEYGANVALRDGSTPKLKTFCKRYPEALWCEVIPPPALPIHENK